jgi:hypothetical protein
MWAIIRDIICKKCRFSGVAEDQDLDDTPQNKRFKNLGKDAKGNLYFRCPSCNTVSTYSPYGFLHPAIKIIFFVLLAALIWTIIKWISK